MARERIGPMRHRVTLLAPVSDVDSLGENLPGWQTVATVWADVRDADAREYVYADQNVGQRKLTATIRYRPGVTNEMKLGYGGQEYNIDSVRDLDQRKKYLELVCFGEA